MLSHDYSFTGKEEFERIKKDGTVYQSASFGASYIKCPEAKKSKFGFIVSKKISNDAVDRNRIKRAMKEAVRQSFSDIGKGLEIVFFAKPDVSRKSTAEIMNEVKSFLTKLAD